MENAVDALKMAAFVILFVGALSIAMTMLNRAKAVSDVVIYTQDDRNFYTYVDESDYISGNKYKTERIVKLDAILPTLYRYYKENYRVEFYNTEGKGIKLYNPKGLEDETNALDIDDEMQNNEYWQGSPQATKEHLDTIVVDVLFKNYKDSKFKEELGIKEITTSSHSSLLQDLNKQTKRVIKYTLQP